MKIIFLDFDGVIVTRRSRFRYGDPRSIKRLNLIVQATGAKIVVSSMWRMGRTVKELSDLLSGWGAKVDVIGKTQVTNAARGHEIQLWLNDNKETESFVILDDDTDMVHLKKFLVKTDILDGIRLSDVKRAIRHLRKGKENDFNQKNSRGS